MESHPWALTMDTLWRYIPSATALLAIALLVQVVRTRYAAGLRHIPGPFLASVTNLWRLYDVSKAHHQDTLIALHRSHGDLVRVGPNTVSVADPEAVKVIYGLRSGFKKVKCVPPPLALSSGRVVWKRGLTFLVRFLQGAAQC